MTVLSGFLVFLAFSSVVYAVRDALDEEFPFQVSISTQDHRHLCGGAVITPRWVLTVSGCLSGFNTVYVNYGSADTNSPLDRIEGKTIVHQKEFDSRKKSRLALIELSRDIKISKTSRPAKLPMEGVLLGHSAKISGWNISRVADVPPGLSVTDEYFMVTENCTTGSGTHVDLGIDEFCGVDGNLRNDILSPGTMVSKSAIVLGILPQTPISPVAPAIFVKMSQHEQWIRRVLGSDSQYVTWVEKVPKDSANSQCTFSLILMGISALFIRYI